MSHTFRVLLATTFTTLIVTVGLLPTPGRIAHSSEGHHVTLQGFARFKGAAPAPQTLQMAADPYCLRSHPEPVRGNKTRVDPDGGLADVFIYVKEGAPSQAAPPKETVIMDQKGCRYLPRVVGVQVGQPIEFINSDATLHNVNSRPKINRGFNRGMPLQGQKYRTKFKKPEVMIQLRCDVHPWMSAYVGVVDHPFFAVTGPDGRFSLDELPSGDYLIEAWHEELGIASQKIHLEEGQQATMELVFGAGS